MEKKLKIIKSLSIRTLLMMVSTILLNAISIITAPIFTRILTTGDFGIYSLYLSWISILAIVFGLQTYGSLNNAKVDFDDKEYENYCANVFLLSMIGSVFWGIFLLIIYPYVEGILGLPKDCRLWLLSGSWGVYMVNFASSYLVIEKKVVQNLLISIAVTLTITFGSIGLILNSALEGYYARVLMHGGVYLITGLCIAYYFLGKRKVEIHLSYWKYCLQMTLPLVIHSLSGILLAQSDRIMLMSTKGEEVVGVYSFCYTIALPISVVAGAINSAWTPEYYSLMHMGKDKEIEEHYNRQMFLITGICCGYIMVSPEILKMLSVRDYWEGIGVISLVIISYFFNFLYFFPANYEFYNKKTKYIAGSTVGAAVLNIVLNYFLIPEYGMFGAAIATILAYVMLFFIHDFIARYVVKGYVVKRRFYLKGIAGVGFCYLFYIFFQQCWIIRWGLGALVGMAILWRLKKQKTLI